ncbi:DUF917 family protein [Leucobacter exalbidus]|uniref:DUF917 family protein n=1 Tax=Leucobacter exalbidus TaxID=662960 RepID=A0A940PQG4_9MICO|nr:DUF917 family protein [Leucobacter exalbidus]MBP1327443.1 DUF917 family protein [Leucobacter exalbidus]
MALTVIPADLPLIAAGASFCGSGGGGSPRVVESMLRHVFTSPIAVAAAADLDPRTPCFAPAFAGSTMLMSERLPGLDDFTPLIAAAERWVGAPLEAVCSIEGGGANALTPFLFAEHRTVVDADCSGRAVPTIDRVSLFLDGVPGLFAVCTTGAGGVSIIQSDRASDVDALMRASIIQAGGVGSIVIAGFTVGDLLEHALHGHLARSRTFGAALLNPQPGSLDDLARQLGGTLLGHGRVLEISQDLHDPHMLAAEISGASGEVIRLVARSEYLAVLVDGAPVAAAPDFIVAIDARSREVLEVTALTAHQDVAVLSVPADDWWRAAPHRIAQVSPAAYGIHGLDPA